MVLRVLALAAFLALLWFLVRYAFSLRLAKRRREQARQEEEALGRRVVAEVPAEEDVHFFLEDEGGFYWRGERLARTDLVGIRLTLNGAVVAALGRSAPPPAAPPEEMEGGERWDVYVATRQRTVHVCCGRLREGVSRDVAMKIFEAVGRALHQATTDARAAGQPTPSGA